MSEFKKGDRVSVTYEGAISWIADDGRSVGITADDRQKGYVYAAPENLTLLERTVEPLAPGSVVRHTRYGGSGYYVVNEQGVPHYISPYADWENSPPASRGTARTAADLARLVESTPAKYVLIHDGGKK